MLVRYSRSGYFPPNRAVNTSNTEHQQSGTNMAPSSQAAGFLEFGLIRLRLFSNSRQKNIGAYN